ncbi:MAG TPA: hypothetical protein VGI66_03455 [Streptosporangiaceae bacterium]
MSVTRGPSGKGQVLARVSGQEHYTLGSTTGLKLNDNCESCKVPSDHSHSLLFEDWVKTLGVPLDAMDQSTLKAMEMAWQASITHHTATLRRIGWLDQKGRVWTELPASPDFDGGSLTPLLIDVRGD